MPNAFLTLMETPDFNHEYQKWHEADLSFGFIGSGLILAVENSTHQDIVRDIISGHMDGLRFYGLAPDDAYDYLTKGFFESSSYSSYTPSNTQTYGFARQQLAPCGRIWESTKIVAWWSKKAGVSARHHRILQESVGHFGVNLSGYTQEYLDGIDNAVRPMSDKERAEILAMGHVAPQKLSPAQKDAVQQFRGTPKQAEPRGLGGYEKVARDQGLPFRRLGDSKGFLALFEEPLKGIVVKRSTEGSMFTAYANRRVAGKLIVDIYAKLPCVFKVAVNEPFRRQGVATALYKAAEAAYGQLVPSDCTSDDAFAFWNHYRPGQFPDSLRHHKAKLIGQTIEDPMYGPGVIKSMSDKCGIAEMPNGRTFFFMASDVKHLL